MGKPELEIDLHSTGGNIYLVYGEARKIVPSERLNAFIEAMLDATKPDAGKKYEDLLAIINQYVELVDTSGEYPAYTPKRPPLLLDLTGAFGNVYIVLGLAHDLLTPEQQTRFDAEVKPALHPSTRKSREEILAIAAKYVHLQDVSGKNPEYPVAKEEGGE